MQENCNKIQRHIYLKVGQSMLLLDRKTQDKNKPTQAIKRPHKYKIISDVISLQYRHTNYTNITNVRERQHNVTPVH